MKKLIYSVASAALILSTSCSDFLERAPQDALSPSTFWQTESDAYLAMVGCYNGLDNIYHDGHWTGMNCLMMDALSDDCFDYFSWEGYQVTVTGNINYSVGFHFCNGIYQCLVTAFSRRIEDNNIGFLSTLKQGLRRLRCV